MVINDVEYDVRTWKDRFNKAAKVILLYEQDSLRLKDWLCEFDYFFDILEKLDDEDLKTVEHEKLYYIICIEEYLLMLEEYVDDMVVKFNYAYDVLRKMLKSEDLFALKKYIENENVLIKYITNKKDGKEHNNDEE